MEKKYIELDEIIKIWVAIAKNGPLDKLPHVNSVVSRLINYKLVDDLKIVHAALVDILEISEEFQDGCGSCYHCDRCQQRKLIIKSIKNHIIRINKCINNIVI